MEWRSAFGVFAVATCAKLLLTPAYRSTDFEVHRNWLAITHSLPLSKWYYESTSEWTLDYPPFFAWFEWCLSQLAAILDPLIVQVENLNYSSPTCVLFQRLSVLASDLTLFYAVLQYDKLHKDRHTDTRPTLAVAILLLLNYGLLIVDHIHFQYNGFLFGLLLLSIVRLLQGRCLEGAFWFACLLNFKHIFLYVAPAYFVYLLKHYCFKVNSSNDNHKRDGSQAVHTPSLRDFDIVRFVKLGALVLVVFLISFGPFLYMGQLGQVISRLFPFKRGLCHAYWAPNVWALYSLADKLAAVVGSKVGLSVSSVGSMTSGLVGEMNFQALPNVSPPFTMLVTLAAMLPALARLWLRPSSPVDFIKTLVVCAFASFLFGWHVHEKAVMMITLPMCLLAVEKVFYGRLFLLLSTAGHVSLFPLLYKPAETPLKVVLFVLCSIMNLLVLQHNFRFHRPAKKKPSKASKGSPAIEPTLEPQLSTVETIYVAVLLLIQVYCLFVHGLLPFTKHFEFLPLLLTSVSCTVGIVWTWLQFYHDIFFSV